MQTVEYLSLDTLYEGINATISIDKLSIAFFKNRFPLPEFMARVHGPSTRPVNAGSGNRPLL